MLDWTSDGKDIDAVEVQPSLTTIFPFHLHIATAVQNLANAAYYAADSARAVCCQSRQACAPHSTSGLYHNATSKGRGGAHNRWQEGVH